MNRARDVSGEEKPRARELPFQMQAMCHRCGLAQGIETLTEIHNPERMLMVGSSSEMRCLAGGDGPHNAANDRTNHFVWSLCGLACRNRRRCYRRTCRRASRCRRPRCAGLEWSRGSSHQIPNRGTRDEAEQQPKAPLESCSCATTLKRASRRRRYESGPRCGIALARGQGSSRNRSRNVTLEV